MTTRARLGRVLSTGAAVASVLFLSACTPDTDAGHATVGGPSVAAPHPPVTGPVASAAPHTTSPTWTRPPGDSTPPPGPRLAGHGYTVQVLSGWSRWSPAQPDKEFDIGEQSSATNAIISLGKPEPVPPGDLDTTQVRQELAAALRKSTKHPVTRMADADIDGEAGIGQRSWEIESGVRVDRFQYVVVHEGSLYAIAAAIRSESDATFVKTLQAFLRAWRWTT